MTLIEGLWYMDRDDRLPHWSEEWLAEIKRRSAEFDAGLVKPIPWSEVKASALKWLEAKEKYSLLHHVPA